MGIRKFYKSTELSTRISIAAVLLILVTVATWYYQLNSLVFAGATAAVMISVEALLAHTRKLIIFIISAVHLFLLSMLSATFYQSFILYVDDLSTLLITGSVFGVGIISAVLSFFISYKYLPGSLWLNLTINYILYYAAVISIPLIFGVQTPVLVYIVSGISLPLIYCLLRKMLTRKSSSYDLTLFPSGKKLTTLRNRTNEKFSNLTRLDSEDNNIQIYRNRKAILFTLPLAGETNPILDKNILKVDQADVTWVMEYLLDKAKEYSRNKRIRQSKIIPVIVVDDINLARSATPIKVRSRKNPDKIIGSVLISKINKPELILRQINDMKEFNQRELTTLIND